LETTILELSLLISLISLNPPLIYAKKKKKKKKTKVFPGEIVELSSCTWTTIIKQLLHYYYYYYYCYYYYYYYYFNYYFGWGKTIYILATKVESFVLKVGTSLPLWENPISGFCFFSELLLHPGEIFGQFFFSECNFN
jgi:hypothetical protein